MGASPSSARVHTEYDPLCPPPTPGEGWTRFVLISDTHGHTFPLPPGDVLLHCGDLCQFGDDEGLERTARWIREAEHGVKIVIAGNHDFSLDPTPCPDWDAARKPKFTLPQARELFTSPASRAAGIIYLEWESVVVRPKEGGRGWKVYGSPGTPDFGDMAFMYPRSRGAELASQIPADVDILMTHGPPRGVLDMTFDKTPAGCADLLARVGEIKPRLHAFGHIHQGYGVEVKKWDGADGGEQKETVFVNASNTPEGKRLRQLGSTKASVGGPNFRPVIVDLKD